MKKKLSHRLTAFLASNKFYVFILIFFFIEASWITLSAQYPQAFDENFHFGVIQIYSSHISPFLNKLPVNSDLYGAISRDPSYLYHYLMSWPLRFIQPFVHTQIYQIVILRFINVILFIIGLILFRKVLLKLKLSKSLTNLSLFLFVLIPIIPQVAGQINYDNLLFLLSGLSFLLSINLIKNIKKKQISFQQIATLMIVCTLTSLVKYAFLPIYLAIVVYFIYLVLRVYSFQFTKFLKDLGNDFLKLKLFKKVILSFFIILSLVLFYQRTGLNIIDYGSIAPNCQKILTTKECQQYYVWSSDTARHQQVVQHQTEPSSNPFYYIGQWFYWMWYRLFFAVNGPNQNYINYPPLPLPSAAAIIAAFLGFILLIRNFRKIFYRNDVNILIGLVILFYSSALFIQGYITYQYTAVLENMNGRYLIPVLLLFIGLIAEAYSISLKKHNAIKNFMVIIVILMFLEGGGILTYIIRSDHTWYITNSKVDKISKTAKKISKKLIITDKKNYSSKLWFFN